MTRGETAEWQKGGWEDRLERFPQDQLPAQGKIWHRT